MIFTAAIATLRRVPFWAWAALFLIGAGLFYGHLRFNAGQADIQAKWDAQKSKDAAEIAKLKAKASEVTVKVETKYVDRIQTVRVKGDAIVKEIPVYISRDLPELPGAWRMWHDAAATNTVPDAAGEADAAPVAPVDAAATVAANYTQRLSEYQLAYLDLDTKHPVYERLGPSNQPRHQSHKQEHKNRQPNDERQHTANLRSQPLVAI